MLVNDQDRVVKLFVENLLWGKITTSFGRDISDPEGAKWLDSTYEAMREWQKLSEKKSKEALTIEDEVDFYEYTGQLYNTYTRCRLDGSITGELHEVDLEAKIQDLEKKLADKTEDFEREKRHNIILAEELEDRQYAMDSYESGATGRHEE